MIGTKRYTEIVGSFGSSRKAFLQGRSHLARGGGPAGSEYPGLSNDKSGENPDRRKDKVSWARFVRPGLVGT